MSLICNDISFRSPRRKNVQPEPKTPTSLQSNLKAIFTRFDRENKGTIVAEDLFPILDLFEREQGISLLDSEPKDLLHKFCQKNCDLELSAEDLHRLISQLSSPLNIRSVNMSPRTSTTRSHPGLGFVHPLSPLSSRKRTTPIISKALSTRKVAATSLRRRSLSQGGFPTKLCFDKEEKKLSPHFSNYSPTMIEDDNLGSVYYGRSRSLSDSADSFDSPNQFKGLDKIKMPKSTRHYHDAIESWQERSYEASSWISSTSEGENSFEGLGGEEIRLELEGDDDDDDTSAQQVNHLTKLTVDLNKRLRQAERNLNLSVRQHEDRISDLQNRIDEMHGELVTKKRDIQELKGHEKTHLSQISMLEAEIISVSRLLTHHKDLYVDLKRQCEEKKVDNDKLQHQLRLREEELSKTEVELHLFTCEQKKFQEERVAYEKHIERLESEVAFAQSLEMEVDELREENQHLRNVVDRLRSDLNDAIKGTQTSTYSSKEFEAHSLTRSKNLHSELAHLIHRSAEQDSLPNADDSNNLDIDAERNLTHTIEHENESFKSQVDDATQKWMDALEQLKQAKLSVKEERQSLLAEIQHLRSSTEQSISRKDMTIQCDLFPSDRVLVDASVQHEFSDNSDAEEQMIGDVSPEAHQQLLEDFNKLSDEYDAQKSIINELLTLNDNQSQRIPSAPSNDNPYHQVKDTRGSIVATITPSETHQPRTHVFMKLFMFVLMIIILSIFTNFIYSNTNIPSKYEFNNRPYKNSRPDALPSWASQEPSVNEITSPDTASTFKFLTQWFDIFSDDHIMVQIPT